MPRAVTPAPTPNPNALRFDLGANELGDESLAFSSAEAARGTAWAERIFSIPGVVSLFAVRDFVTVTKETHAGWEGIVPHVVEVLQETDFAT